MGPRKDELSLDRSKTITIAVKWIEAATYSPKEKMFATTEQKNMPRGQPKSGRPWKTTKTRFTTIKKSRGLKSTSEEKLKFRDELKKIKSLSRELIEQRKQIKENKKQRRRENLERQRENEKKSEILQVIKNSAKVKRMKKKHLRKIEKEIH